MSQTWSCWPQGVCKKKIMLPRRTGEACEAMAKKVAEFKKSIGGFKLAQEQLCAYRWFGEA